MDKKYFLAIDIGASSGRHILGSIENGKMVLEEIYRFKNGAIEKNGSLVWDVENLVSSIIAGIKKCKEIDKIPYSIGIDTWGVDYALLDENDKLIDEIFSYRDSRTQSVMDEVHSIISEDELYERTGISKQVFNTIYQLYADKKSGKLKKAKTMLLMPNYLQFVLTGNKVNEYTDASTTGLLNAKSRDWDYEIIEKLGFNKDLFKPLVEPGTVIGNLTKDIQKEVGFNAIVCTPATHDTASAVMAVPNNDTPLYISSGTWSLIGIETNKENTSKQANECGYTNEGGINKSIRFLKNIMGLWMIQNIKKEYNDKYSFAEFGDEANKYKDFDSIVDVNDLSFFAPKSMIKAVQDYCKKTNQKVPNECGEIVRCVYTSLAKSYKDAVIQVEKLTGKKFDYINIVGGGCQNGLLNELTAKWTGKTVMAGPIEATATGNILSQMISGGIVKNMAEGRKLIEKSFDVKEIKG
ncbi:MAG: rhamnulokinase [Firmicutes bacterium]|nr:rhamnulokinase [Candidatus Caballimonas caccae]